MPTYPTLIEMGIQNPRQIDRYSVQTANNIDILRVVYKRKKGSLLPSSKRFRFPRTEKLHPGDGNVRAAQVYYEISPALHKSLAELDQIVQAKSSKSRQLEIIKEEIQRLQEETSTRLAYIDSLIDGL